MARQRQAPEGHDREMVRQYTPLQDMSVDFEGAPRLLRAGVTRIEEGHPILKGREQMFTLVEPHFALERDTAAR